MKMHEEFKEDLVEFLESEATDYGMSYKILEDSYEDDFPRVDVQIFLDGEFKTTEEFAWTEDCCSQYNPRLCIDMGEDHWEHVCECEYYVKYFWMKVAPELWGKK